MGEGTLTRLLGKRFPVQPRLSSRSSQAVNARGHSWGVSGRGEVTGEGTRCGWRGSGAAGGGPRAQ